MKAYTVVMTVEDRVEIVHTMAQGSEHAVTHAYATFIEGWVKTADPTLILPTAMAYAVFNGHIDPAVTLETPSRLEARVEIT